MDLAWSIDRRDSYLSLVRIALDERPLLDRSVEFELLESVSYAK